MVTEEEEQVEVVSLVAVAPSAAGVGEERLGTSTSGMESEMGTHSTDLLEVYPIEDPDSVHAVEVVEVEEVLHTIQENGNGVEQLGRRCFSKEGWGWL